MVSINYATREVSCKIVFYGPGLSGKTTNLQYVHAKVPSDTKGKLISLATDSDRTLYFDFLPINIGSINGFAAKFQLYTVPGQVYYNATRKLVLRGTDGLVFVADSQPDKMDENIESLNNLKENMAEYGYDINEVPIVIQYNKQDLPGVLSVEEMRPILNPCNWPEFRASATEGFGVFDTLKCILKIVLEKAKTGGTSSNSKPSKTTEGQPATPPPTPNATPMATGPVPTGTPSYEPNAQTDTGPIQQPVMTPTPAPALAPAATHTAPAPVPEPPVPNTMAPADQETPALVPTPMPPQPEISRQEVVPQTKRSYRPFPGNTVEEEKNMSSSDGYPGTQMTGQLSHHGSTGTNSDNQSNDAKAMVPRMQASKPRRKRSFFKRLFGLK